MGLPWLVENQMERLSEFVAKNEYPQFDIHILTNPAGYYFALMDEEELVEHNSPIIEERFQFFENPYYHRFKLWNMKKHFQQQIFWWPTYFYENNRKIQIENFDILHKHMNKATVMIAFNCITKLFKLFRREVFPSYRKMRIIWRKDSKKQSELIENIVLVSLYSFSSLFKFLIYIFLFCCLLFFLISANSQ